MNKARKKLFKSTSLFIIGIIIGVTGVYIGEINDAPGTAMMGILLMIILI